MHSLATSPVFFFLSLLAESTRVITIAPISRANSMPWTHRASRGDSNYFMAPIAIVMRIRYTSMTTMRAAWSESIAASEQYGDVQERRPPKTTGPIDGRSYYSDVLGWEHAKAFSLSNTRPLGGQGKGDSEYRYSRRQACCHSKMICNAPSQSQFAFISLSLGREICPWG